jgi:hypothetical protein
MPGAYCIRSLNHKQIDYQIGFYNRWSTRNKLTPEQISQLHECCDLLDSMKSSYKIVTNCSGVYVYLSTVEDMLAITDSVLGKEKVLYVNEVDIIYDKNYVYLKNPIHAERAYLKDKIITKEAGQLLLSFLINNSSTLRPNKRLLTCLNSNRVYKGSKYISRSDFIEYSDSKILLFLNLIMPDLVRKTFAIKAK